MPKLSLPSNTAWVSFFANISFVLYSGSSRVLKQVWATGKRYSSSVYGFSITNEKLWLYIETLGAPVINCKNLFIYFWLNSDTIYQNHFIIWLDSVYPYSYLVLFFSLLSKLIINYNR